MGWRITLLGKMEATREGVTLSHFESTRAIALLARLALFPQRTHPREELVELLWPEINPEVARGRLRHTLLVLRRQLEAGVPSGSVFIATRQSVGLNPEAVVTDVAEFEKAIANRDYAKANTLYTGELLPGLWDEWILSERHRLEALKDGLPLPTIANTAPVLPISPIAPVLPIIRSLPSYLTTFFGRDQEQQELASLLGSYPLVTLTGLGGTGKTRLATQVLKAIAPRYAQAVFISLAECVVASQVLGRIRAVLDLPNAESNVLEQICLSLEDRPTFFVLDNVEQIIESGGAELIKILLTRLPQLTCLVTSRRPLGIDGERVYPLTVLSEGESIALFLDRAQATRPGFTLTQGNQDDIRAVCHDLEGIPLAIELAAARLRAFSVSEMREEMQTRLDWLTRTGVKGNKGDRHHSLAATLEWSWRLLTPSQQQFLAALSLFRNGWQVADMPAVTDSSGVRERLEELVLDSLLVSEETASGAGAMRFSLLETIREFVQPRLENANTIRKCFRTHFLAHPTRDDNMVAAWEYAIEDADGEHAYAIFDVYYMQWAALIGFERARFLFESTLALPPPNPLLRLRGQHQLAFLIHRQGERKEAIAMMDAAVEEMAGASDNLQAEAFVMRGRTGMFDESVEKTIAFFDRSLALSTDPIIRAEALRCKGCALTWANVLDEPEHLFDEAKLLYPPQHKGHYLLLLHQADLARRHGNWEEARVLYQSCAEQALLFHDEGIYHQCRGNLVDVLPRLGRWDEAVQMGKESLLDAERIGDRLGLLCALWNLAYPLLKSDRPELSAQILSFSAVFWEQSIGPLTIEDTEEKDDIRGKLAEVLDETTLKNAWLLGSKLTLREALILISTHCNTITNVSAI
jgi:predicted ATPase